MSNDAGPEAKQWALAATAVLTTLTRREPRHDLLGGTDKNPETEGTAKTILANSWSIDGRDKLVSTLEWLAGGGHSQDYQKAAATYAQAPPQQRQQDPSLAFVNQFGAEIGNRGLLAWDLGRLLAVAGWGYLAGYCSEDEAWGAALSAGVRLRSTYASWDEYGKHYRLGALFFDAGSVGPIEGVLAQLGSAPNSPWRLVAWCLGGAGAGAPPGAPPGYGAPPGAPPGYGAPPGVPPTAPPGGGGFPPPTGAPPGGMMGASPPGAPAAYGGVPVVAPPPGSPGAPSAYGGVPVITPPPGGAPPPYGMAPPGGPGGPGMPGMPGAAPGGNKKTMLLVLIGGGGFVVLLILVAVVWHFTHRHEAHESGHEPAHEQEHGKPKGKH